MVVNINLLGQESNFIKELFPDWADMQPGEWSKYTISSDATDSVDIGLYREPLDDYDENSGTYTLQGFWGDDVIICQTVDL